VFGERIVFGESGDRVGAGHSNRFHQGEIMGIFIWLLVGLLAGLIARLLVPGADPMGVLGTMVLGLVGSFVGGFLANLAFEGDFDISASGLIGSIVGSVVVLLVYRSTRRHAAAV
jgi:uncharacterized membrane protein YeaQ/YmgE (transglycosylase-associated protein family)